MSAHGTVEAAIIDGIRLFEAGQVEAAREQFHSAAAMTPHTATSYYELGLAFHRLGEFQAPGAITKAR
jgi:Flp pilus assembly protein TadD